MITPKDCIESFESYRAGDKAFCKLASVSDKNDKHQKNLGFWLEVLKNDNVLVLSIKYEWINRDAPVQVRFFSKRQFERFLEDARLYVSSELDKALCTRYAPHGAQADESMVA